jgi:RNA polymerase sigma-70 factor (ECF subfamily)
LAKDISFVYGLCNDYDLAQDLAQETFIIVWQNWKHLEMNPALGLDFPNSIEQLSEADRKENRFPKQNFP